MPIFEHQRAEWAAIHRDIFLSAFALAAKTRADLDETIDLARGFAGIVLARRRTLFDERTAQYEAERDEAERDEAERDEAETRATIGEAEPGSGDAT